VEFVHPVIVGKRALPAVAVTGPDDFPVLRMRSRPVDALLVLGSCGDTPTREIVARAGVWGLLTIWLGAESAPPSGVEPGADHSFVLADPFGLHGREAVLLYHLLWELTHVCLEHPGLLADRCAPEQVCITCSDQGRPAEIVSCDGDRALVRSALGLEDVDVSLVPPATPGATVLIHAGVAVTRLPIPTGA
jgi:hypothetical protein